MVKIGLVFLLLGVVFGMNLEEVEKKVEKMKKEMRVDKNVHDEEAKERALKLYEHFKRKVVKEIEKMKKDIATGNYKLSEKRIRKMVKSESPILVFMSSSVPKEVWVGYMDFVEEKDIPAVFLLRGCIGGCRFIRPTIEFLKALVIKGESYREVEIAIDPTLFRKYEISEVPCVVWQEKKSCGDWSFEYHLEVLGYEGIN